jgi:hypothetical protein
MLEKRRSKRDNVVFIPRNKPEAHDEGPRLLPLDPPKKGSTTTFAMQRYVMLADLALGKTGRNGRIDVILLVGVNVLWSRIHAKVASPCAGIRVRFVREKEGSDAVLALREISRTLKPGGPLAIITVTSGPAGLLQFRRVLHCGSKWGLRVFEVQALERMLGEAGFESCHSKTSGSLLRVRAEKRR